MFKVMIRDNMSPKAKEILEQTGQIEVVVDNDKATSDPKILASLIHEFDGLGVRSGTKVTAEVFDKAANLKVVGRAGIGVDNIDVASATGRGIVVMNAPGGNTVTTGEHAISLMLALARNIPQATASIREGKWEKKKFMGVEIEAKTLGIVGLGQIGRVVAGRAQGLGMKVIAADPYITKEAAGSMGVELVLLDDLLSRADFITLHVPRLEETKNLIRKETIEKMKPGVRIINCARGEVVNMDDLYEALMGGHVAGAGLDVYPKEPPDFALPIFQHPNVIFTPHLGASTGEAQEKVATMIARQMVSYLIDGVITNAVNFPSISMEVMEQLRPHISLAERMGAFLGQMVREPHDVHITYGGYITELDTRVLTRAALKGLLGSFTDMPVNYVNAPALAKDKGIGVEETISQQTEDYMIRIRMPSYPDELNEIWGTIFAKKYQRLIRLGHIDMDAIPEGTLIVVQSADQPGVVGHIGMTLAKHGTNIARFQAGSREGRSVCVINIDSPVDDKVMEELRAVPHVTSARRVQID